MTEKEKNDFEIYVFFVVPLALIAAQLFFAWWLK